MSETTELGLKTMDAIYGPGFSKTMPEVSNPMLQDTIDHLFGEIWSRPGLSIRDRRLLVMGATAALGRSDLIEIQARGALINGELSPRELREAVLQLHYYVGWGNGTHVNTGVEAAITDHEARTNSDTKEHEQ
jgi:4-carboxymuconolactone decarboxylase